MKSVPGVESPITDILLVGDTVWVSTAKNIIIFQIDNLSVVNTIPVDKSAKLISAFNLVWGVSGDKLSIWK